MCEGQKVLLTLTTEQIKLTIVQRQHLEICYTKFNQNRSRNVSSGIQIHVRPSTSTVQCHSHQTRTCPTVLDNKQTPSPNFTKRLQLNHCHWLTVGQTDGCVSTSHKAIFLFHSVQKGSTQLPQSFRLVHSMWPLQQPVPNWCRGLPSTQACSADQQNLTNRPSANSSKHNRHFSVSVSITVTAAAVSAQRCQRFI